MEYRSSLYLYIKDLMRMIPICNYFFNCNMNQVVVFKLVEGLDNSQFGLEGVNISVSNMNL